MTKWAILIFTVIVSSGGDLLCSRGMSRGGELEGFGPSGLARILRYIVTRKLVILGAVCDAIAFFSLLALLRVEALSVAVPATALGFVLDTLGARLLLKERVNWRRWLGVICVSVGVLLAIK